MDAADILSSDTVTFEGAEPLKSLGVKDGKTRVGAYAIRFSGPDEKDLSGEYFTAATDFGPTCGDGATTMFHHGQCVGKGVPFEQIADMTFGQARVTRDDVGIFVETCLDHSNEYEKAIAGLCESGALKWSSGSASHLVRKAVDGGITRWHPIEFSFTATPVEPRNPAIRPLKALPTEVSPEIAAAFGVSVDSGKGATPKRTPSQPSSITVMDKTPEQLAAERKAEINSAVKARELAIDEISAIGEQFHCLDAAKSFIRDGKSPEDFRKHVMTDVLKARPVDFNAGIIGMNQRELGRFSVLKACHQIATKGRLEGLEKECHEAAVKAIGRDAEIGTRAHAQGFIIPEDVMRFDATKAQNMGTATAGGFTMQPTLGPMIELLRKKMRVAQAGATMLGGLTGDVYLPQHTGGASAYWVSETGALTDSQSTFAQKKITPHRVGSSIPYSTQFLQQSSIDAESFIRNDATIAIALAKDLAALHGTGADGQPLGIANTVGINQTVTYGGAPVWGDVVEHETGIAVDDADFDVMAFILSALTVGKWKTVLKDSVAGAGYLLTGAGENMEAGGFRAFRTNQVTGNISFFGVWAQLIMASWAGLEVIVDPYALKKSGQIEITFNELVDQLVRQPLAFNVSTDSAAQ